MGSLTPGIGVSHAQGVRSLKPSGRDYGTRSQLSVLFERSNYLGPQICLIGDA